MDVTRRACSLGGLAAAALLAVTPAGAQTDDPDGFIEEVTTEDVRRFIDPTLMISTLDYSYSANFLPGRTSVHTNTFTPFWAINRWTGLWAEIPVQTLATRDDGTTTGAGAVLLGWGAILHEDLDRRFTTAVVTFEALAPTGDPDRGTGVGTWVFAPGGALAINPTDKFPIYVIGRYLHSLESLGGDSRERDTTERPDLRVRAAELTIQTLHILPKGFYLFAIPSFVFNLNQSSNIFSLGVGVGRALNPRVAVSGSYLQRVAGRETFNRELSFQVSFLFGARKDP